MNYKLKRDLPFAEAGVKIYDMNGDPIDDLTGCRVHSELEGGAPIYIGNKEKLLVQGWIEEVEPREWWVNMHKGSGNNYFCETKDEAIRTMWGVPEYNHIIKVREVME